MSGNRTTHGQATARLLSPQDVADWLGVPVATVYRWRHVGGGPRGSKVGRHVRYRPADVEAWLEECADDRTPDAAA